MKGKLMQLETHAAIFHFFSKKGSGNPETQKETLQCSSVDMTGQPRLGLKLELVDNNLTVLVSFSIVLKVQLLI
jgi:hypothetical protein